MSIDNVFCDNPLPSNGGFAVQLQAIKSWWAACEEREPTLAGFSEAFASTGCPITEDSAYQSYAGYNEHNFKTGRLMNYIKIGPDIAKTPGLNFLAVTHEAVHAIQWQKAACLHAAPIPSARIVLCPYDYVKTHGLTEKRAYALQALFGYTLSTILPDPAPLLKPYRQSIISCRWFRPEAYQGQTLNEIVDEAGDHVGQLGIIHYYHRHLLDNYTEGLNFCTHRPIFVRVDDDDILAIKNAVGPTSCKAEPADMYVSTENKYLLTQLDQRLGIRDRLSLPTLREALAEQGVTREYFLRKHLIYAKNPRIPDTQPRIG